MYNITLIQCAFRSRAFFVAAKLHIKWDAVIYAYAGPIERTAHRCTPHIRVDDEQMNDGIRMFDQHILPLGWRSGRRIFICTHAPAIDYAWHTLTNR